MLRQIVFSSVCILLYIIIKNVQTKQNKVKYYSKVFVMYFYVFVVATIACPFLLFQKRDLQNGRLLRKIMKFLSPIYGTKWQLENAQYLAGKGGAVIISNHQSTMDALGVFYATDKIDKLTAIVKKELWYLGIIALAAYKCGVVFIDRKNSKSAYQSLEKIAKIIKKDESKIWICPEGTRNSGSGEKLLPFKRGAFTLAVAAQVPIIPVVFSPLYFINEKKCILYNNGKVIMRCLEPVPTEGLTRDDIPELQERLHKIVLDTFEKLSKEILNDLPIDTPLATEIQI